MVSVTHASEERRLINPGMMCTKWHKGWQSNDYHLDLADEVQILGIPDHHPSAPEPRLVYCACLEIDWLAVPLRRGNSDCRPKRQRAHHTDLASI